MHSMIPVPHRLLRVIPNINRLRWLGSKTQARGAGAIKNNELAFEEDVAIDGEANPSVRLDAAEALGAAWGVIDIFTGDDSAI
jgi:hypothetical protein